MVRSDIIVLVQRRSQVVMARSADCLVSLASVGPRALLCLPFFARYGFVVLPDPGCFGLVEDLCQGSPWDEFDYKCPHPEARTSLLMAGSLQLERDINEVEHDGQLCRPMQGSAAMSCVDDKNLNAIEVLRVSALIFQIVCCNCKSCSNPRLCMTHFWVFLLMNGQLVKVPR